MSRFEKKESPTTQASLDRWLSINDSSVQPLQPVQQSPEEFKVPSNYWAVDYWDDTISCIELTMKRRKGYLVNWMEGEPRGDSWDGSIDNQEKNLEEDVSKYGWQF
ncbi:MAG: hypothetical protein ABIM44_08205 [candidate division WOR-3 bacterium]